MDVRPLLPECYSSAMIFDWSRKLEKSSTKVTDKVRHRCSVTIITFNKPSSSTLYFIQTISITDSIWIPSSRSKFKVWPNQGGISKGFDVRRTPVNITTNKSFRCLCRNSLNMFIPTKVTKDGYTQVRIRTDCRQPFLTSNRLRKGLTKTSRDAGTPSLGPVSHQVDGLGAITVSDARTPQPRHHICNLY